MYDDRSAELNRVIYLFDILLTVITFLCSFWLRNRFLMVEGPVDLSSHVLLLPLIITLLISSLSYFGAYSGPRYMTVSGYAWSIFRAVFVAMSALLIMLFFLNIQYVSRLIILIFSIADVFVLLAVRIGVKKYFSQALKSGRHRLNMLVIGTGERAREVASELRKQSDWGVHIVGYLDPDPERVGTVIDGDPVLGTVDSISECLKKNVVDEVVIAIPRTLLEDAEPIAFACEEEGIRLRLMADIFRLQVARISLAHVGNIPLLTLEPVAQDENKLFLKRLFDLVITGLAMPFVLPVISLIAVAVKLDSSGPVFFVQQRVGLRKHLFPMFKFRSMYEDAEERLKEIEHLNEAEGPIFKMTNDPRVTRVGRFIRRTSLDELPQLFNVLRGEMSLVGPRPMSIRDVDLFDQGIQRKRFSVKPGITCLWQISGRSNLPFHEWLRLDLEYIDNWSLWLDFKILVKTIPAVLFSRGAV